MTIKKEYKSSPDSMWQRSSNTRQYGAKEIQDMLGIEDEDQKNIQDKQPIKMMDIVMQAWGLDMERDVETDADPNEPDFEDADYEEEDEDDREED